jgi:hypothetical protein
MPSPCESDAPKSKHEDLRQRHMDDRIASKPALPNQYVVIRLTLSGIHGNDIALASRNRRAALRHWLYASARAFAECCEQTADRKPSSCHDKVHISTIVSSG